MEEGAGAGDLRLAIPANQEKIRHGDAGVNDLRRQGLEISKAGRAFKLGTAGAGRLSSGRSAVPRWPICIFSIQNIRAEPRAVGDAGWTFQLMRSKVVCGDRQACSTRRCRLLWPTSKPKAALTPDVKGDVLISSTAATQCLMKFRFERKRQDGGRRRIRSGRTEFSAGSIIVPNADPARLGPMLKDLGLCMARWLLCRVKTHDLDVPRIGYVRSWSSPRTGAGGNGARYLRFRTASRSELRERQPAQSTTSSCFRIGGRLAQVNMRGGQRPLIPEDRHDANLGAPFKRRHSSGMGSGACRAAKFVRRARSSPKGYGPIFPIRHTPDVVSQRPTQLFCAGPCCAAHLGRRQSCGCRNRSCRVFQPGARIERVGGRAPRRAGARPPGPGDPPKRSLRISSLIGSGRHGTAGGERWPTAEDKRWQRRKRPRAAGRGGRATRAAHACRFRSVRSRRCL